ncbi:MAG: septal ring lytic transglycosylase RlpA family protein [Flavobacterium sp.]|jgi:rare lipoprotein A|nr:septal ring lytic transglycosylase RlpA family protein [Flavobacterium sp.]
MKLVIYVISSIFLLTIGSSFKVVTPKKSVAFAHSFDSIQPNDSITLDSLPLKVKPYKTNAHASYYHDKFNGRRTASGQRFDNSKFTAAHKTLKFGTKVKVTNPKNNKSVVVTINDRGPFTKGREIDLSKKAFFEIAGSKYGGHLSVTLEIIED